MKYSSTLLRKEEIAEGTMTFHFKKPEGFDYKAGQFVDITLLHPPHTDAEGNTRAYSLVSTPDENELRIATRMRDTAFKNSLKDTDSISVEIDGPMGSFTLHHRTEKPAVFLMGGIGVTPAYSIICDSLKRKTGHTIYLLYSNRTPEGAAFLSELTALAKDHPEFIFVPVMTDVSADAWDGETGRIDAALVARHVPDIRDAIVYVAGPQGMVGAMRKLANDIGVMDDDIRTEEFSGY